MLFYFNFSHFRQWYREAVRQRKALSRTSSNILLNSVHMAHTTHNMHHSHHMNYLHPSDCDLNLTLRQLRRESDCSSISNIEVIISICNYLCHLKHTIIPSLYIYKVSDWNWITCTFSGNKSNWVCLLLLNDRKRPTNRNYILLYFIGI